MQNVNPNKQGWKMLEMRTLHGKPEVLGLCTNAACAYTSKHPGANTTKHRKETNKTKKLRSTENKQHRNGKHATNQHTIQQTKLQSAMAAFYCNVQSQAPKSCGAHFFFPVLEHSLHESDSLKSQPKSFRQ